MVAASGGVDSLAAILLLQEQGYDVKAVTFITWNQNLKGACVLPNKTTPWQAAESAAEMCAQLNVEHRIVDLAKEFENTVISYFEKEYWAGKTPNPCTFCNPNFKFFHLVRLAEEMGCDKISTGHYVGLRTTEEGRHVLFRAQDDWKDQSFMLWNLPQEILAKCIFPLQSFSKLQIKEYVAKKGFPICAKQQESFSICFIADNNYKRFLSERNPELAKSLKGGFLLDENLEKIGTHEGFPFYTIGQCRKFIHSSPEKLYIARINSAKNEVYLAKKLALFQDKIIVEGLNFMKYMHLEGEYRLFVRIRGKDLGTFANVIFQNKKAIVTFEEKVFAPAAGQSAVFYETNELVVGGTIV